jgi:hypothetical protein
VISKDTGFDPLVTYLRSKQILASRSDSIEAMPCFAKPPGPDARQQQRAPAISAAVAADDATDADPLMQRVLDDLIKRKSAKPGSPKTLKNTMQKCCGSEVPADRIDALYAALIERGYVRVQGTEGDLRAARGHEHHRPPAMSMPFVERESAAISAR